MNDVRKIDETYNRLLADLRNIAEGMPRHQRILGEQRERILARLEQEEREEGYVDYITVSSSLVYSMSYKKSLPEMRKEALYNNLRKTDIPPADDYLEGLTVSTTRACLMKKTFKIPSTTSDSIVTLTAIYLIRS